MNLIFRLTLFVCLVWIALTAVYGQQPSVAERMAATAMTTVKIRTPFGVISASACRAPWQ